MKTVLENLDLKIGTKTFTGEYWEDGKKKYQIEYEFVTNAVDNTKNIALTNTYAEIDFGKSNLRSSGGACLACNMDWGPNAYINTFIASNNGTTIQITTHNTLWNDFTVKLVLLFKQD